MTPIELLRLIKEQSHEHHAALGELADAHTFEDPAFAMALDLICDVIGELIALVDSCMALRPRDPDAPPAIPSTHLPP